MELTPLMNTMGQCELTYQTMCICLLRFWIWTRICSTARYWISVHRRGTSILLSNAIRHLGDHHVDLPVLT